MKTVIFNNNVLNEYVIVEEIRDSILPPLFTDRTDNVSSRGSRFRKNRLKEKIIEVDIRMIDGLEDKKMQLASVLYTENLVKLEFDGYYYMAILDGSTELVKFLYTGSVTLEFLATDPIAYGENRTNDIVDNVTLILGGTYKTLPKFSFNISSTLNKIRINNMGTGKYVEVNHNFINGDKVEIDFNDKWKVRKNGSVIAENVTIESDFFSLKVGENKLSVNIPCTLEYVERWL